MGQPLHRGKGRREGERRGKKGKEGEGRRRRKKEKEKMGKAWGRGKGKKGKGRERGGEERGREREGKGYCVAKTQIIWLSNLLMLSYLMNVIPETFMCTKFDIYVFITSF
jgi:hypothetical protein